ncbi:MAG: AzlD domain-containing protein [Oscillospiraceae bacterium]|nr:AzlD domain-containing protein [Oscillospiraceae bacterium]
MIDPKQSLILIAVMAGVTMLLRFLPFILFSKKTPKPILFLGEVLPYSIIAMLLVYCLKEADFAGASHGIPEIVSVLLVAVLHKWKHNTLLSILSGTICYMLLVQLVFA